MPPFHLAFAVDDLSAAETFYAGVLGCRIGRRSEHWIDFDFWGHQAVAHLSPEDVRGAGTNQVDNEDVPVRHFGVVLPWDEWERLAERLKAAQTSFLIEPGVRFRGKAGEQGTFFVKDPAGNALEFKTFRDASQLFAH